MVEIKTGQSREIERKKIKIVTETRKNTRETEKNNVKREDKSLEAEAEIKEKGCRRDFLTTKTSRNQPRPTKTCCLVNLEE